MEHPIRRKDDVERGPLSEQVDMQEKRSEGEVDGGAEARWAAEPERIAQMVVAPVARVEWEEVAALPETARGEGGFGHTGR